MTTATKATDAIVVPPSPPAANNAAGWLSAGPLSAYDCGDLLQRLDDFHMLGVKARRPAADEHTSDWRPAVAADILDNLKARIDASLSKRSKGCASVFETARGIVKAAMTSEQHHRYAELRDHFNQSLLYIVLDAERLLSSGRRKTNSGVSLVNIDAVPEIPVASSERISDMREALAKAICEQPSNERKLAIIWTFYGYSAIEIGDRLDVCDDTIRNWVRALAVSKFLADYAPRAPARRLT